MCILMSDRLHLYYRQFGGVGPMTVAMLMANTVTAYDNILELHSAQPTMDPRHPNIAFAANTGALISFISLLFSAFLPIFTPKWSNPETILLLLIPIFVAISWWGNWNMTPQLFMSTGHLQRNMKQWRTFPQWSIPKLSW